MAAVADSHHPWAFTFGILGKMHAYICFEADCNMSSVIWLGYTYQIKWWIVTKTMIHVSFWCLFICIFGRVWHTLVCYCHVARSELWVTAFIHSIDQLARTNRGHLLGHIYIPSSSLCESSKFTNIYTNIALYVHHIILEELSWLVVLIFSWFLAS